MGTGIVKVEYQMRNLQKTGLTLLAAMAWLGAEAYDFKENGLYYNIIDRGSKTCAVTQGTESYSGEVSVPEEANGYKVIGIEDNAFEYSSVETVRLPESVTWIGISAFHSTPLREVSLPSALSQIGESAFQDTQLTSIAMPESVTQIARYLFSGCGSLVSVELPSNLRK